MTRRHYHAPPIIEALIDIHATFDPPVEMSDLAAAGAAEGERYPIREQLYSFALTVDPKMGTAASEQRLIGYRFWNANRSGVFQFRTDGMLFSQLPPYSKWESWRDETQRLWSVYVEKLRPRRVHRLAVRYINRIQLASGVDLGEFFDARPELNPASQLKAKRFVMRVESDLPSVAGGSAALQLATADSKEPGHAVLLDLDLQLGVDLAPDARAIWEGLETLHDHENSLFESCITDKARELFR